MDILRFVNSEDTRKYLAVIRYEFSSMETAWLIYKCRNATIDEKHEAWKELIRTMPDCKFLRRYYSLSSDECNYPKNMSSLFDFLTRYMEIEDRCIKEFFEERTGDISEHPRSYVYWYRCYWKDGSISFSRTVYSSISEFEFLRYRKSSENILEIRCIKMPIDSESNSIEVSMNSEFEPMNITAYNKNHIGRGEEWVIYSCGFSDLENNLTGSALLDLEN